MTTRHVIEPELLGGLSGLGTVTRIARVSLHDAVLNQIRDMIIEGQLAPGTRINEGQVGALLGVSRTPLREAIKTLTSEGLVEIQPSKGAVVRKLSHEDIADILDVLKVLEQAAAHLVCARAPDEDIKAIGQLHDAMLQYYAAGDRLPYFKLNQAIHTAIVRSAGNAVLAQTHGTLQARIKRVRFIGHEGPERWAAAVAEHQEMVEALTARNGSALAEVLGRHLDMAMMRVRDVI